jgi:AAA+ ATPase superfamily predicted ATPase
VIRFIDREVELEFLEKKFNSSNAQFVVIYGRRRVGKTELIKQFCKEKNSLYFLADKRGTLLNVERFAQKAADQLNDVVPKAENFYDFFRYLIQRIASERAVIVIDEFSYLMERDNTISSVFQVIWDEYLKDENVMLILCGSSVSMMVEGVLSQKAPLYGRRTGQWKLDPLKIHNAWEFHREIGVKRAVEFYSVTGGVPLYILEFDAEKDVFENIMEHILTKGEFLYDEAETLLKEELRTYYLYLSIFEAIAMGKTRIVEIADYSKIAQKDLPKYLTTLMKLELVGKEHPVTEKEQSKKTRYFVKDNFFRFYFKYIHPNKTEIESGNPDKVISVIKKDFDSYVGKSFENVVYESLVKLNSVGRLPFSFTRIGRMWGKIPGKPKGENTYEIDIVALNDRTKEILFTECKWKNRTTDADVLKTLAEKSRFVKWNNSERKEYFAVFSKSGFTENAYTYAEKNGVLLYTLPDVLR